MDHRIKGEDSRRPMFDYQIKTMGRLSPDWAGRQKVEIDKILQQYPYDDSSDARVCMVKDLVSRGCPQDHAWVLGCAPRTRSLPLEFRATLMLKRQQPGAMARGIAADAPIQGGPAAQGVEPTCTRRSSRPRFP
jgi:hypothetical protein